MVAYRSKPNAGLPGLLGSSVVVGSTLHCKNKSVVVTPNLGVKVLCTYDTLMGCHGP